MSNQAQSVLKAPTRGEWFAGDKARVQGSHHHLAAPARLMFGRSWVGAWLSHLTTINIHKYSALQILCFRCHQQIMKSLFLEQLCIPRLS